MKNVRYGIACGAVLFTGAVVSAQGQPDTRTAEQVYKNIKVMQGTPANELGQSMHVIKAALGVDCTYCHVDMQFDRDDVPRKDIARRMYTMMVELNRASFGGGQVVTCYSCHQGRVTPRQMPALPVAAQGVEHETRTVLPSVDDILARYVTAVGGEQALRKVTSRVITATQDVPTGPGGIIPVQAEIQRSFKAPNQTLEVVKTTAFTTRRGFNGTVAWSVDQRGRVIQLTGIDAERAARAAQFYEPITLKQQYRAITVDGIESINGHDAYVVTGSPDADTPERLYFDVASGLMLRKQTYLETQAGKSPFEMNFEDYRSSPGGVRIPFVVRMTPASPRTELASTSTFRVKAIAENISLDSAMFAKADAGPPAPTC